jgi:hypothetical protein
MTVNGCLFVVCGNHVAKDRNKTIIVIPSSRRELLGMLVPDESLHPPITNSEDIDAPDRSGAMVLTSIDLCVEGCYRGIGAVN